MAGHGSKSVDYLRKSFILLLLFGCLFLLFHYAPENHGQSPASLLALGFVILAAYLIGELSEVIKLPHITGYLLAGLFLGPSFPETIHQFYPEFHLLPPFDKGILSTEVIHQLGLLDTLALPLICITAGGALKPEEIKKAIKPIMGLLFGQIIAMFVGIVGLFFLISGPIEAIALGPLTQLQLGSVLALGGVAAAISIATSDAATIAIVVSTRSKGPMTTNIVSVAVLKDIAVVVLFSAMTTWATVSLGMDGGESLLKSVGLICFSGFLGIGLGFLLRLYMRYINAELLLMLVALIYAVSFLCDHFHLESALVFIAAGFIVANGPDQGGRLISEVERLSTPVFVVFFTLAGAKLHLDVLVEMALLAMLLVAVRTGAFFIGCRTGGMLTNADEASQKYAWMGFVSQAGLAITLANSFPGTYGPELGGALFSLILAGVAVHEVIGPALLQSALSKAGELPSSGEQKQRTAEQFDVSDELWGNYISQDPEIQKLFFRSQQLLSELIEKIETRVIEPRLKLISDASFDDLDALSREELAQLNSLFLFRGLNWIKDIEKWVESQNEALRTDVDDFIFKSKESDSWTLSLFRRLYGIAHRVFPSKREIDVRGLGRYHFTGVLPSELKDIAMELFLREQRWAKGLTAEACEEEKLQIVQRVHFVLKRRHHKFCTDLQALGTFELPAWRRRVSLSFSQRNAGFLFLEREQRSLGAWLEAFWWKSLLKRHLDQVVDELSVKAVEELTKIKELEDKVLLSDWEPHLEQAIELKRNVQNLQDVLNAKKQSFFALIDVLVDSFPEQTLLTKSLDEKYEVISVSLRNNLSSYVDVKLKLEIGKLLKKRLQILKQILQRLDEIEQLYSIQTIDIEQSLKRFKDIIKRHSKVYKDLVEAQLVEFQNKKNKERQELSAVFAPNFVDVVPTVSAWQQIGNSVREYLHSIVSSRPDYAEVDLGQYQQFFSAQINSPVPISAHLRDEFEHLLIDFKSIAFIGPKIEGKMIVQELVAPWAQDVFWIDSKTQKDSFHERKETCGAGTLFVVTDLDLLCDEQFDLVEECLKEKRLMLILSSEIFWKNASINSFIPSLVGRILDLPKVNFDQFCKILLHRHNLSGFSIRVSQKTLDFRFWKSKDVQKIWLKWLYQFSKASLEDAIDLWLLAIAEIDDHSIMLSPELCRYRVNREFEMSSQELLVARQCLRFGWCSLERMKLWFGAEQTFGEATLIRLEQDGFLKRQVIQEETRWYISSEQRPRLRRVLSKRGWL